MTGIETALLIGVVGLVIFINIRYMSKRTFQCKTCGHTFPPSVRQAFFQIHINRQYIARCPRCGKLRLCRLLSHRVDK